MKKLVKNEMKTVNGGESPKIKFARCLLSYARSAHNDRPGEVADSDYWFDDCMR